MEKTLLIGNGLNRTLQFSISWSELLCDIAKEHNVEYIPDLPMPLEFERIINTILKKSDVPNSQIYSDVKARIARKVKDVKLPDDAIHRELATVKSNAIITTNYDYLLEYAYNRSFNYKGKTNLKYLWEATSVQQGIKFYHMHGMADNPASICLGYEHYMGIVENLRSMLNAKVQNRQDEMKNKRILKGEDAPTDYWGERFYTTDVDIIGLGLTTVESDIWWLLTHRASIYYTNYCDIRKYMKNQITYYDVIDDLERNKPEDERARQQKMAEKRKIHQLLKGAHVRVVTFDLSKCDGEYENAYRQIMQSIKTL